MDGGIRQGDLPTRIIEIDQLKTWSTQAQAAVAKLSLQDKVNLATGIVLFALGRFV